METESSCPENAANIENHQPLTARERLELFKQQKFQKKNEKAGKVGDKQPVARKALQQRSMQEDNKIGTKIDKNIAVQLMSSICSSSSLAYVEYMLL